MKAPLNLNTAIEKVAVIVAFLLVVPVIYPETVFAAHTAQSSSEKALVFEISSKQKTEYAEVQKQTLLTYDELAQYHQSVSNDILAEKVRVYLESKGSPLAVYAKEIVQQPQWQRALAISYVESNFGKRCADNNCSGIGVRPGHPSWRKYPTKLDWFKDMTQLLEKPIYKDKYTTCKKMKGVYVVPGSARWVNGCDSVSNELLAITEVAHQERIALSNTAGNTVQAAAVEVELLK